MDRLNNLYSDAMKKAMPNMDFDEVTELYKKNLEYMSSINSILSDITKTMYHVHVDFMKDLSGISQDVFTKSMKNANNLDQVKADTQDAMDLCSSKCSKYTENLDTTIKGSGEKIVNLTKDHIKYATEKIKNNPISQMFKTSSGPANA